MNKNLGIVDNPMPYAYGFSLWNQNPLVKVQPMFIAGDSDKQYNDNSNFESKRFEAENNAFEDETNV